MEDIETRIRKLEIRKAVASGPSDEATILSYLFNILANKSILDDIVRRLNFQMTSSTTNLSPKEIGVLQLMRVLFTVEGMLTGIFNLAIYALIVNAHHDICSTRTHDFVSSFEDICDIDLSVKIKFLEKHDYGFLTDVCPRKIRNAIAHSDFVIKEDGTVEIEEGRYAYSLAELAGVLQNMYSLITIFGELESH